MVFTAYRSFLISSAFIFSLVCGVAAADPPAAEDKLPTGAVLQFGRPRFQSPTFGGQAAFSPDGKLLATWAQNTAGIAVWDLAAGKIVRTHKARGSILNLRWRADGKLIALFWFGPHDFLMQEWNNAPDPDQNEARSQELSRLSREKSDDNFNSAFFLDDDHVAAVFFKSTGPPPTTLHYRLEVYKFAHNTISRMAKPEGAVPINQWEWQSGRSLDGKVLFFFEHEKLNAYDWMAIAKGQGKPLWSFSTKAPGDRDRRPHLCVSPDGKQVVVSLLGGALELWDGPNGKLIRSYPNAESYPYRGRGESVGLALSPDGKRLAVMSRTESGEAGGRILDLATGKDVVTFTPAPMPFLKGALFSPDGKRLAQIAEGQLRLLNAETGADIDPGSGHRGQATSLMVSPDGKTLITAGTDLTVRGWDVATGREKWKTAVPQAVYLRFATGDSVAFEQTGNDGEVAKPLLDLGTGAARSLPGDMGKKHEAPRVALGPASLYDSLLSITPDGKKAATLDMNGPSVRIWTWPAGKLEKTWPVEIPKDFYLLGARAWYTPGAKELIVALQCHHQSGLRAFYPVVLGGFETATGKRLDEQHLNGWHSRLLRDDAGLVTVSDGGEVRDPIADKLIVKLEQSPQDPFSVLWRGGMAVSPEGDSLAVGGGPGRHGPIQIYDLKTGRVRKTLESGSQAQLEMAFLPDGRLVSAGDTLLLWAKP